MDAAQDMGVGGRGTEQRRTTDVTKGREGWASPEPEASRRGEGEAGRGTSRRKAGEGKGRLGEVQAGGKLERGRGGPWVVVELNKARCPRLHKPTSGCRLLVTYRSFSTHNCTDNAKTECAKVSLVIVSQTSASSHRHHSSSYAQFKF
ncbi:hypothetical protein ElyMa_003835000 [Elysia marginata]|uniref:Uncharacterized protein n=1 Tax=Elysia marginata TaxID=1093978 RepID=A0AAV4FFY8_9GAST|nr:hypothetical protein ElyMa_003835000 [Elysia marginata]